MTYTVDTDLWDLRQRINILEVNSDKHNMRLNKLEDGRDDKVMPEEVEGVDFSHTIPGKGYETATVKIDPLASQKEVALDWYINQYQNMCKEYNKVKIELDDKQKVLELTIEQRDRYLDQIINQNSMIDALERDFRDSKKTNQRLRAFIKNHEDRILELEKEVEYHKAFGGSNQIKKLKLVIKYLEDKNKFISDLNDEYRKMVVKEDE